MFIVVSISENHGEIMDYMIDPQSPAKKLSDLSFVVIGGMSFHGAKIATYLHNMNFSVTVIEDAVNIEPDPIRWYRWTQLPMKNQDKIFIDFSLGNKLATKLHAIDPDVILYVPTGIIESNSFQGDPVKIYQLGSATVKHFQQLLSIIPDLSSFQKVILLSTEDNEKTNPIYKTWMSSLEQLMYFFGKSEAIDSNFALIKVNGVFGPWKETIKSSIRCWYIDSIAQLVLYISNSDVSSFFLRDLTSNCEPDVKRGVTATNIWIDDYNLNLTKQKRNVIAGGVLVVNSKAHWWRSAKKDDLGYLDVFIPSAMNHKADIVIIHNCYTDNSISKYKSACPPCHFVRHPAVNERIAHDQRFYMIYEYLLNNPDIGNMVTADSKDVVFDNDPFKIMAKLGDYFYIGFDIPYARRIEEHYLCHLFRRCVPNFKYEDEVLRTYGFFNSGILGGSRPVLLALISRILLYLDIATLGAVCDMAAANAVFHAYYYDRTFSGYPFSAPLAVGIYSQQGVAVTHKPGDLFQPTLPAHSC